MILTLDTCRTDNLKIIFRSATKYAYGAWNNLCLQESHSAQHMLNEAKWCMEKNTIIVAKAIIEGKYFWKINLKCII